MITYKKQISREGVNDYFFKCLSTDDKPVGTFEGEAIENGSRLLELDTGKVFLYDAENEQWNPF